MMRFSLSLKSKLTQPRQTKHTLMAGGVNSSDLGTLVPSSFKGTAVTETPVGLSLNKPPGRAFERRSLL